MPRAAQMASTADAAPAITTDFKILQPGARLRRRAAMAYWAERSGQPVAYRTFCALDLPYVISGRDAIYHIRDLDRAIAERARRAAQQVRNGVTQVREPVDLFAPA